MPLAMPPFFELLANRPPLGLPLQALHARLLQSMMAGQVPGLQLLVKAMLGSIPKLMDVLMLLGFIFAVFGILGVRARAHAVCALRQQVAALQ